MITRDPLPTPDILRPTELHDLGDLSRGTRRSGGAVLLALGFAALLAFGHAMMDRHTAVAGDPPATAAANTVSG